MSDKYENARANAQGWYDSIKEMVEALDVAREREENGEDYPEDAARRIYESVLSVEVRSGWFTLEADSDRKVAEYRILLTTGGPGLQLTGTLNEHGEPETAELQMQDWGLPWRKWDSEEPTRLTYEQHQVRTYDRTQTLLTFARCFYLGE